MQQRGRWLGIRLRRWQHAIASGAAAGWAAGDRIDHCAGKQPAAINTRAAMQRFRQTILLVCRTPQRHTPACSAQVNWLLFRTLRHLAPVRIAHPAEIVTDIADYYANIPTLVLIAHSVHLCSTVLAAQLTQVMTNDTMFRTHAGIRRLCLLIVAYLAEKSRAFCIETTTLAAIICTIHTRATCACGRFGGSAALP
jgi:hypothetical protein